MANTNKDIDKILQDIKKRKSVKSVSAADDALITNKNQMPSTSKKEDSAQRDISALLTSLREEKKKSTAAINNEYMPKAPAEASDTFFSKKDDTLATKPNVQNTAVDNAPPPIKFSAVDKTPPPTTLSDTFDELSKKSHIIDEKFVDFFTQSISVSRIQEQESVKPKKRGLVKKKYITDSLALSINDDQVKLVEEKQVKKKRGFFDGYDDSITSADTKGKVRDDIPSPSNKEIISTAIPPAVNQSAASTIKNDSMPPQQSAANNKSSSLSSMPLSPESLATSILSRKKATLNVFDDTATAAATPDIIQPDDIQLTSFIKPIDDDADIENPSLYNDADTVSKRLVNDITAMFSPAENDAPSAPTKAARVNIPKATFNNEQGDDNEVFEELILKGEFTSKHDVDEDCDDIIEELNGFKTTLRFRAMLGTLSSIVLLYLSFAATFSLPIMEFMAPSTQPVVYYLISLVFYGITLLGFAPTIFNGLRGLFSSPTSDSFLFLPTILCLVQLIVAIINADKLDPATNTIFAGFVATAMVFNSLGKLVCANTITRNLALADIPSGINAGYLINNPETVKRLARTLEEKAPQVLVSRKAGSISNFISGGFSVHSSEIHSKRISIFSCIVTLICFIMSFVLTKDFTTAIFAAVGSSVLMVPLSHTLISSIPSSLLQKALNQVGALVNGWYGIDQISKTTHVSFDAKHLFPRGTVVLHGIKTFEQERLDHAILYAASIIIEHCEILRPVFMNVIENKTDILYPIESCEYKAGQGYIAWIEHNRVILGNRSIMSQFDIELPPISVETKFTSEGKKPIYLSINGKLFGMFVVSYHQDKSVKENLDKLVKSGVNIILKSNDFNLDSQLLELIYKMPLDTIQVLNQNETSLLQEYTQYIEKTESSMAHIDSLHSLVAGFCGADSAKAAAGTCNLIQFIGVIIGGVLSLTFAYSQTLSTVPLTSVFLLSFGWLGLSLMRAFAKKYY